ncbi:MAG: hypothetical protein AB1762_12890 [Gemmatimonadota bacterium]
MAGISKASPPANLGGAARTIEWIHWPAMHRLNGDQTNGGFLREVICRTGKDGQGGLMTNGFDNGSAGFAGNGGKGFAYYRGLRASHLGISGALAGGGTTPNDQFCNGQPAILTERPAAQFTMPLAAWDIVFIMARKTAPVAAITRDLGALVLTDTQTTGFPSGFRANAGDIQAGFAVFFDGISGELRWMCRNVLAGAALTENVALGFNPGTDYFKLVFRLVGATPSTDASVRVIVNDSVLLTRNWGAGTVLPSRATIPTWGGAFRSWIRNADTGDAGNCALAIAYWAVRAANSEAELV